VELRVRGYEVVRFTRRRPAERPEETVASLRRLPA
jgi:hypothetical protein